MDEDQKQQDWLREFHSFMREQGISISLRPIILGKPVDLYKLFTHVMERGGYKKVKKISVWRNIAKCLGFTPCLGMVPAFKKFYSKMLLPFERHCDCIRKSHSKKISSKNEKIAIHSAGKSYHDVGTSGINKISDISKALSQSQSVADKLNMCHNEESCALQEQKDNLLKETNRQIRAASSSQLENPIDKRFHRVNAKPDLKRGQQDKCNEYMDMSPFYNYASYMEDGDFCLISKGSSSSNPFNRQHSNRQLPPFETSIINFPVHQNVRLKKLPFYDVIEELLGPCSLLPRGNAIFQKNVFSFHLTSEQAASISISQNVVNMEYLFQVQLRFCILNFSCEQNDFFPPGLSVEVNEETLSLPLQIPSDNPIEEPRCPSQPLNITSLVKLNPAVANHVTVTWNTESGLDYVVAVYLVYHLTCSDLLERLKYRDIRQSEFIKNQIKEILCGYSETEISTTSFRLPLICPLGKARMNIPCCSTTCNHFQCFDGFMYLKMNEKKPTWSCPICDKSTLYDDLIIDGFFQEVLSSQKLSDDVNEILLHPDGSWSPVIVEKKLSINMPAKSRVEAKLEDVTNSPCLTCVEIKIEKETTS